MKKKTLWLHIPIVMLVFAATAMAVVPPKNARSYVSNIGNDANTCTLVRPCATFAGAYNQTLIGGEIDALTNGDYGPLTIDHAITIDGQGSLATITVSQGSNVDYAITINAGATDFVVLRNLSLREVRPGPANNTAGIALSQAGTVVLTNISIDAFDSGILNGDVNGSPSNSGAPFLVVQDTRITNCDGDGILLFNSAGVGAYVSVLRNVVIAMVAGTGILANGHVAVDVTGSTIGGGGIGVYAQSTAEVNLVNTSVQYASSIGVEALASGTLNGGGHITLNNCLIANNNLGVSYGANSSMVSYGNNQFSNNTPFGDGPLTTALLK